MITDEPKSDLQNRYDDARRQMEKDAERDEYERPERPEFKSGFLINLKTGRLRRDCIVKPVARRGRARESETRRKKRNAKR
jgi:hypothetical protein